MDLGPIFLTTDTSVYGRDMAMSLTSPAIPSLQMLCVDSVMEMLITQEDDKEMTEVLLSILDYCLPGEVRERIILFLARKRRLTKPLFDMLSAVDVRHLSFAKADLSCTDDDILEDVWEIASGIDSFDFSGCEISPSIFRMLVSANIQSPPSAKKVLHLNFSDSEGLTDYIIGAICTCFCNLETLHISNCSLLTAEAVSHVASAVFSHSLTNLDMSHNSASPESLAQLSTLVSLRSLNISFMKDTGDARLLLSQAKLLERLDLSALHMLEDASIECMLSEQCASIAHEFPVSEESQLMQHLLELRLTESYLSSDSFLRIFCKQLEHTVLLVLDLSWSENISAVALSEGVKMCPSLQSLLLRSTKADNATVVAASEHCPCLTELNVSRCDGINDVSLCELTQLANLQSLDLSWASIQNVSTVNFLYSCSSLRVLSVQGCKGLETDVVEALIAGAAPRLKFIDLGWVNMFSSSLATQLSCMRQDLIVVGE